MTYFRVLLLICLMLTPAWANTPLGSANLIVDGNMEGVDTSSWTNVGATLSKETTSPHRETNWLKILNPTDSKTATNQDILTIGKTYRITGWARGDGGTGYPKVYQGVVNLWVGATSTTWQYFDVTFTATVNTLLYFQNQTNNTGDYCGFDDIRVEEVL